MVKTSSAYQTWSGAQRSTMCATSSAVPAGLLRRCEKPKTAWEHQLHL